MKKTLKKQLYCLLAGNEDETKINGMLFLNESGQVGAYTINKSVLTRQDLKTLSKYGINLNTKI